MKKTYALLSLGALTVSPASAEEAASFLNAWSIVGTATSGADYYDISGDPTQSPFPEEGLHAFSEASIDARNIISPYETLHLSAAGLANRSDYRLADEDGLILERFSAEWEKGDAALPFRATVGDFFAESTPRTISRALRGATFEAQTGGGGSGSLRHSTLAFAGEPAGLYRDIDPEAQYVVGVSHVVETADGASAAVATLAMDSLRDGGEQLVGGLAAQTGFTLGTHELRVEGEVAALEEREDGYDAGAFFALAGRDAASPLTYGVIFEQYGAEFNPANAPLNPGSRTFEAHAGWRFENGFALRGRAVHATDGVGSNNPSTAQTLGVALSGAAFGFAGALDGFATKTEDRDGAVRTQAFSTRFDASRPLGDTGALLRVSLDGGVFRDRNGRDSRNAGGRVALDLPVSRYGWSGFFSPAATLRGRTGASALNEGLLNLDLSIRKNAHTLDLSLGGRLYNGAGGGDGNDLVAGLRYGYEWGPHRLELSGDYDGRRGDDRDADSIRVGVLYTLSFNKPAERTAPGRFIAPQSPAPGAFSDDIFDPEGLVLTAFYPDQPIENAIGLARDNALGAPVVLGDVSIFEIAAFPRVAARQRLALEKRDGLLESASILVDLDDPLTEARFNRTFQRIRDAIADRYGPPSFEDVENAANLAFASLGRRAFWRTANGGVLLGVPRRTDRIRRIEVRISDQATGLTTDFWGLNAVR